MTIVVVIVVPILIVITVAIIAVMITVVVVVTTNVHASVIVLIVVIGLTLVLIGVALDPAVAVAIKTIARIGYAALVPTHGTTVAIVLVIFPPVAITPMLGPLSALFGAGLITVMVLVVTIMVAILRKSHRA